MLVVLTDADLRFWGSCLLRIPQAHQTRAQKTSSLHLYIICTSRLLLTSTSLWVSDFAIHQLSGCGMPLWSQDSSCPSWFQNGERHLGTPSKSAKTKLRFLKWFVCSCTSCPQATWNFHSSKSQTCNRKNLIWDFGVWRQVASNLWCGHSESPISRHLSHIFLLAIKKCWELRSRSMRYREACANAPWCSEQDCWAKHCCAFSSSLCL